MIYIAIHASVVAAIAICTYMYAYLQKAKQKQPCCKKVRANQKQGYK